MKDALITTREFQRLAGDRSSMWIHRHERSDADFPTPTRYAPTGPKFWRPAEVERFLESRRDPRPTSDEAA